MTHSVYIDGQAGTTGLDISARLRARQDICLLEIEADKRKDPQARAEMLNSADLVILCLPDNAARESVAMITNSTTRVIDASTAHRTHSDWVYGLAEMYSEQRAKLAATTRTSNPGCYPQGVILSIRPLIEAGLLSANQALTVHAQSGYSGGGRQMIEAYQTRDKCHHDQFAATPYALELNHKHRQEMNYYSSSKPPVLFAPTVCDYYQGMLVHVPLNGLNLNRQRVHDVLSAAYEEEKFISVQPLSDASTTFLDPTACNLSNRMDIFVFGNEQQVMITSRYDNLGKGACGAAIQNMNLMLGIDEISGLSR